MARPKLGDSETERLQLKITKDEIEAIDDWRYANRVPSRSEAVRRLIQIGMYAMENGEREMKSRQVFRDKFGDFLNGLLTYFERQESDDEQIANLTEAVLEMVDLYNALSMEASRTYSLAHSLKGDRFDHVELTKLVARAKELMNDNEFLAGVIKNAEKLRDESK